MKLYVIQDATTNKYWRAQTNQASMKENGWIDDLEKARFYNTYSTALSALNHIKTHIKPYLEQYELDPLDVYNYITDWAKQLSAQIMVVELTPNSCTKTDYMEYKTSSKSLCLITPTEFDIITPTRTVAGKTYFDVPADCIAIEIEKEKIKDSKSKKSNKTKYEPKVLALKVLVRHQADLSKLDRVITIAQEHNVFITDYKVELMSMLRRVSDVFDGYNNLKTKLDEMELGLDMDS